MKEKTWMMDDGAWPNFIVEGKKWMSLQYLEIESIGFANHLMLGKKEGYDEEKEKIFKGI